MKLKSRRKDGANKLKVFAIHRLRAQTDKSKFQNSSYVPAVPSRPWFLGQNVSIFIDYRLGVVAFIRLRIGPNSLPRHCFRLSKNCHPSVSYGTIFNLTVLLFVPTEISYRHSFSHVITIIQI